ncbi:MAG TPA: AzlC family ABC transporter permease [Micromonosporaceae bacterium]|nr:AzlC family ABC transporter permease [Micromonosporaceae bacterium]
MRTAWRTADARLVRDILAIAAACCVIGVSFGAIAVASGMPAWAVVTMSVLVFAGGAQFMAVGMLAAGNPLAAVLGGLLLNARHLPFGLVVADAIGPSWRARLVGSHLMVDEAVAFALAQDSPERRRAAYWLTGGVLFVAWNSGTLAGIALGEAAGDPARYGLDAAFPAGLVALILPSLRDPTTRRAVLAGAAVAVLAAPFLPAGVPVLLAVFGVVLALPARKEVDA